MDFWISVWISADGVRDFFRDGPLGSMSIAGWCNCPSLISYYHDGDLPTTEEVRTQIQNRPATNHLSAFIAACTVADGGASNFT